MNFVSIVMSSNILIWGNWPLC